MNINEGLKQMWNSGVRRLDVYWLEENEEGHEYWWCDVINDDLNDLCKTSWIWTVMSRVEYEKDEEPGDSTSFADWLIIVDEEKFSDGLISDHIKRWSRDRGFEFEVKVIDSAGTKGEKQMLDAINGD